jgi:hypothetical protein
MMAIRTRWFDDQLEASLGMPLGSAAAAQAYVVPGAAGAPAPRQVVVLGSGMDSRPWRLKLPAGLHWYEVDRADVLEAKEAALEAAGAELGEPVTPMRRSYSVNALLERKIGSFDHHATGGGAHPLRAELWSAVATDLGDPSWVKALAQAGFDASKPTAWVAEGCARWGDMLVWSFGACSTAFTRPLVYSKKQLPLRPAALQSPHVPGPRAGGRAAAGAGGRLRPRQRAGDDERD